MWKTGQIIAKVRDGSQYPSVDNERKNKKRKKKKEKEKP